MKESIFFAKPGEKGLNETSAAHLCALASQIELENETALNEICFVNVEVAVVGNAQNLPTQDGIKEDEFNLIETRLLQIAKMHRFIAWFAEARKVLEAEKSAVKSLNLESWCKLQGIEYPSYPVAEKSLPKSEYDDILKTLNIKEYEEYLGLQATAAVFGKFIHPDRPMDTARKALHYAINHPYKTKGEGRDTTVYHSTPSIDAKKVDAKFAVLQKLYREYEQRLNRAKAEIRKKQTATNVEENRQNHLKEEKFLKEFEAYRTRIEELNRQFHDWVLVENEALSKVKLAIPSELAETVDYLNNLVDNNN